MARKNNPTNRQPYEVWLSRDSRGRTHAMAYVPSKRGYAEITLYDWPEFSPELQQALLDPSVTDPWKTGLLDDAYKVYRQRENTRKSAAPGDPEEHLAALESEDPSELVIRTIDAKRALGDILSLVSAQQSRWIQMSLGDDERSYVELARMENPDGDAQTIERRANSIRRAVTRAVAKIRKEHPHGCPDSHDAKDA